MAIANLQETINSYILRRNQLNLELTELQDQKRLAIYSQGDVNSLLNTQKAEIRAKYKELFEADNDSPYLSYTEMPEFEEEIQMLEAKFQDELDQLTAWETIIDEQITTDDTELQEVQAHVKSYETMLSENITDDFKFGLDS